MSFKTHPREYPSPYLEVASRDMLQQLETDITDTDYIPKSFHKETNPQQPSAWKQIKDFLHDMRNDIEVRAIHPDTPDDIKNGLKKWAKQIWIIIWDIVEWTFGAAWDGLKALIEWMRQFKIFDDLVKRRDKKMEEWKDMDMSEILEKMKKGALVQFKKTRNRINDERSEGKQILTRKSKTQKKQDKLERNKKRNRRIGNRKR